MPESRASGPCLLTVILAMQRVGGNLYQSIFGRGSC
jgi:hypothetical protein